MKSASRGFTLIELLVVISIIGMLSSVILAGLTTARNKAFIARGSTFNNNVRSALFDQGIASLGFDEFTFNGSAWRTSDEWSNNVVTFRDDPGYPDSPSGAGMSVMLSGDNWGDFEVPIYPAKGFTISVWIKTTETSDDAKYIFSNRPSTGGLGLAVKSSKVYTWINSCGGPLESNASVSNGIWHHIVWTNDEAYSRIYIDGGLDLPASSHCRGDPSPGPSEAQIGADPQQPGTVNTFIGQIDDFRLYSKELSRGEIQHIYAQGLERLNLATK